MNNTNFEFSLLIELHNKDDNESNIIPVRGRRSEITDISTLPTPTQQPIQIKQQPAPKQPSMTLPQPKPIFINNNIPVQNTQQNIQQQNIQQQNTQQNTQQQNTQQNIQNTKQNKDLNDALLMASVLTL